MLMKRIEAPTLAEAMERTRKECGDSALLVETRRTRRGYVVVAARPPEPGAEGKPAREARPRTGWTRGFRAFAEHAREFGVSTPVLQAVERAMIGTRVELGREGDPAVGAVAARILAALIRTADMPLPRYKVTAFVGATGVGKTTTLSKLAARAVHDRGESVAIVTVDTYRVAAVEQLRAFADMLDVPIEVAFTPQELRRAVRRHAGADRVLVDTSGRSPHDRAALAAMRGTLGAVEPAIALCLPAAARRLDGRAALAAFGELEVDCVILTKWDETTAPGEALSLLIEQGLPISHVADGQEVPRDIAPCDPHGIAGAAFGTPEAGEEQR